MWRARSLGFLFDTVLGTFRQTPETYQDEAKDGKFKSCWGLKGRGEQMPQTGGSQTSMHRHHLEGAWKPPPKRT